MEALRNHLARQIEEIESFGDRYRDQGLMFPSQVGTPMNAKLHRPFVQASPEAGQANRLIKDATYSCRNVARNLKT